MRVGQSGDGDSNMDAVSASGHNNKRNCANGASLLVDVVEPIDLSTPKSNIGLHGINSTMDTRW